MAWKHTTMGRTYGALHEWWEKENAKGIWSTSGEPWGDHQAWSDEQDRDHWHRNWGELLNYHTLMRVRNASKSAISLRLSISVTHSDPLRLSLVKIVTGGTLTPHEYKDGAHRLRIESAAAFEALKAGRMYVDPGNKELIEVLDAAMRFNENVPKAGELASDQQITGQLFWQDHLDHLTDLYQGLNRRPHDCEVGVKRAGLPSWEDDPPKKGVYALF